MRFFNILFICLLIGQLSFAQTLFESESMAQRNEPVRIKASTTKKTPGVVTSKNERYVITNLESLILRGDLQFFYEIPNASGWSSILYVHTNPQEEFNDITGSMGVLGGGRLYFEESLLNSNIFLQGLVGFNRFSDWDLMISLEFGQRIQWKKNVFLDLALAINRSYDSQRKDPMAYLKLNLSFGLDAPVLPFL